MDSRCRVSHKRRDAMANTDAEQDREKSGIKKKEATKQSN